jgi:hypothetical protein
MVRQNQNGEVLYDFLYVAGSDVTSAEKNIWTSER